MNNYESTEKSLKRWLKTKVKVTMATVVGFLIAGTVVMGADATDKVTWETVDGIYTNKIIDDLATSKFVVGKDGKLVINTHGSAGELLADLIASNGDFEKIRSALSQNAKVVDGQYINKYKDEQNQGKTVITGALAGQGKYNTGLDSLVNLVGGTNELSKKVAEIINRTNTKKDNELIEQSLVTEIGNETSSPVILGLMGGDMIIGTGKYSTFSLKQEPISISRKGDTTVTLNNGNVFGATTGSTAVSLGNIAAKKFLTFKLQGEATANIIGNTTLNINNGANAAGVTAGGLAAAIGGTAVSTVNGNSTININSKVSSEQLEGITVGLFGGGMAVSTLGGSASANITGTTNVEINDGLSVGVIGGGLAVATDASQYLKAGLEIGGKKGTIDENGNFIIDLDGIPPITVSGLRDGGTSTVKSGDINVDLNGKTAAAGVLGNGIAVSHQNSADGTVSKSTVTAGDINITVNVDDSKLTKKEVGDIINTLKELKKEDLKNNTVETLKKITGTVANKGIVVGLGGNGVAVARDKGVSNVTAGNTVIDLKDGYIVGVIGNGIASGNASSTVKADSSVINIDGAEVIGVSGSGIALDHGVVDDKAFSKSEIGTTTVNLNSGSADGIFGGGIAVTKDHADSRAETITSGKSTINVNGGIVDKFGYHHIANIFGTHGSFDKVMEAGKDVAITAGGVASRNGYTEVAESEINITDGTVKGDILAGGIAVAGGVSEVGKSTINIGDTDIQGSVYGTGMAIADDNTVGNVDKEKTAAIVGESYLNINGYKNSLEKIAGFDKITISKDTDMKVNNILLEKDEILTNSGKLTLGLAEDNTSLITIKGGEAENDGTIVVKSTQKVATNKDGKFTSAGTIQISDKTVDELKDFEASSLFGGKYTFTGMLKDKDGKGILQTDDVIIGGGDYSSDEIINAGKENGGEVNLGDNLALVGGETSIDVGSVNIYNNITVKNDTSGINGVTIENTPINIDGDKHITIGNSGTKADLTITSGEINGEKGKTAIEFAHKDSSLTLDGTNFTGNIGAEGNTNGTVNVTDSTVDGDITAGSVVTGNDDLWNQLFGSTRLRTALFAAPATEVKTTVYGGNVTANDRLGVINENAVYNGKVTFNGADNNGINIGATTGNKASARFNGDVKSNNIKLVGDATAYYASNITMTGKNDDSKGTTITGGTNIFEVSGKGENALLNTSNKVTGDTGVSIKDTGVILEANIGKDTVIDLGSKTELNGNEVKLTETSEDFYELSKVGTEGNKYALNYKDNIASENGYSAELNDVFAASQVIHSKLNEFGYKTVDERAEALDKFYSSNIYSETVRAAYDNVKMNEEAVESLARKSEVGKWTAEGKALYSKNEYDRKGIVKDYSSEVESTGLMAAFGYGVNETTTAGVAFSGVKQDVDTEGGSADADLFYLGVYGNKVVGNYDFTAGLGYQFGEYDADNNILGTTGDKYDTQALSGYVQGRYTADLGDGLSVQPKVKLGYTYIDQDNAKDSYFGVSDAEISTFDAEVGFDVVKSVQFEKSQADVRFGLSYTKAMGDTDKEFTGRFYGTEASNGFDVLGAELAENTVKFDLGAEVTNENGFFYNGGFTYEFGSNDTEAYGVNVGVGYKF